MPTQEENLKSMANKLGQGYNATTGQMIDPNKGVLEQLPTGTQSQRDANVNIINQATAERLGQKYNVDTQQFEAGPTALEIQRNKEQAAFNQRNPVGTKVEDIKYTPTENIASADSFKSPTQPVTTTQATSVPTTPTTTVKTQKNVADSEGINFNSSVGREDQIGNNLTTITQQTPALLTDRTGYDKAFGYATADEGKKALLDGFFKSGKQAMDNAKAIRQWSNASVNDIGASLLDGSISSSTYNSLLSDPLMSTKIKKAEELNRIAGKKKDITTAGVNQTTEVLASLPTIASAMENNELSGEEIAALTSTPEQVALKKKKDAQWEDLNKKTAIWDSIENDIDKQTAGGRYSATDKAQMVANARKLLLPELNRAERNYNNTITQLTDLKKEALGVLETNLGLYKEKKAKEDAILTEERQQKNALALSQAQFEQKIKQQAQLASDPYTAISSVVDEYAKLGVRGNESVATKVKNAEAFIANGGTIGGYVDQMIKDFKAKDEYKAIVAEKTQQKPITVGKDSFIYDPVTKTFLSPSGSKLDKTSSASVLGTPEGIGSFTTQRKNDEGVMSTDVQCGMLVNDWYKSVTGQSAGIGNSYSDKLGTVKRIGLVDKPEAGSIFVSNPLKNSIGHTGIVQSVNADGSIVVREANKQGLDSGGPAVTSTYSKKQADEMMFAKSPSLSSTSGLKDLGEYLIDTQAMGPGFSEEDVKLFTDSINKYVDRGDEETVNQLFRERILARKGNEVLVQGSSGVLNNISTLSKDIQDYVAKNGDTGLFKGTIEQIQNKLGATGDPELASIANKVGMLTADYIKEISGTAASDPEVQRLISLLPSTKTTVTLNDIYLKNFDQKVRNRVQSSMEVSIGNKYKALAPKLFPELYTQPKKTQTETKVETPVEMLTRLRKAKGG